jgi:alpha-galactosidase
VDNKFPNLIDGSGQYTKRNDVIYSSVMTDRANNGPLTANQGGGNDRVGPELGFGHVMGWFHDEPVLLVKASQGNRSLDWDYLPPGSERFEVGELTYAGYGDRP